MDEAIDNIAFACQRHYAQVLINELSLNNANIKYQYTWGEIKN